MRIIILVSVLLLFSCAVQTLIIDPRMDIPSYSNPKGIVLSRDTIRVQSEKMIQVKYFGLIKGKE